ncbi:MAG: hypothetical protein J5761_07040 [Paludibacteraceae bacterium]|nr:hypothetical protein [Paludibacteraceae bacterium]
MKKIFLLSIMIILAINIMAQKNEFGVIAGGINGLSYKYWFSEKGALQTDLAVGLTAAPGTIYLNGSNLASGTNPQYDFTINPNIEYHLLRTAKFQFYTGAGINLGLISDINNTNPNAIMGKFGLNAIIGIAVPFNPIMIAFDFRPGYGLGFYDTSTPHFSFFDWKLGLALRYCF